MVTTTVKSRGVVYNTMATLYAVLQEGTYKKVTYFSRLPWHEEFMRREGGKLQLQKRVHITTLCVGGYTGFEDMEGLKEQNCRR